MSRAAQAVAAAVAERKVKPREMRSRRMSDEDVRIEPTEQEQAAEAPTTGAEPETTVAGAGDDMRKKTKAKRTAKTSRPRKTARKAAPVRKARAQRQAPTATDGSGPRTFRLVAGIPEQPREGTHGRAILDSIHERRLATFADIRSDVPKAVADATLRKYLVMFKAEKIIAVEGE